MCKTNKTRKINNRLRKVREDTLFKLYNKLPYQCQSCSFNSNCPQVENMTDCDDCNIYERAIELNELIELLKEENINISRFCEDYGLKKEFLMEMLHGKMLLSYKYYKCLLHRLHLIDEYEKYKKRFQLEEERNEVNDF